MPLTSWNPSLIKSKNFKSLRRGSKLPSLEPLCEEQKQNISSRGKKEKHLKSRILYHSKQRWATHGGGMRTLRRFHIQELTLPDLKTYNNAIIIKTVWYQCKERHKGQWNRVQKQTHTKSPLIFSKGANKEKIVFSRKGARTIKKKGILTHTLH